MSDEVLPTVHVFGLREPAVMRIDPTQLAKFIMGADVPVDADLAAALRAEFNAQEQYRHVVMEAVQKTCRQLLQDACEHVGATEHPITSASEAFWRGYALGKYEALSGAAAALSEIPIIAAIAMETPDADDAATLGEP